VIISCKACGKRLKVPDHLAGRRAKCACGAILTIPKTDPNETPIALDAPNANDTPASEQQPRRRRLDESGIVADLRRYLPNAARSVLLSVAGGLVVILPILYFTRSLIAIGDDFAQNGSTFAFLGPAILFGAIGAVIGYIISVRLAKASDLAGLFALCCCTGGVILLVGICRIAGGFMFPDGAPELLHFGLLCLGLLAVFVAAFHTFFAR
jgi:hypothetical protein